MGSSWLSFFFSLSQAEWDNNSNTQVQNAVYSNKAIALSHLTVLKQRMGLFKDAPFVVLCSAHIKTLWCNLFHYKYIPWAISACSKLLEKIIKSSELMAQMSCSKLSLAALSSLTAPLSLTHFSFSFSANQQITKTQYSSLNKLTNHD